MSSIVTALAAPETLASAAGGGGGVSAGYGVSLTDLSGFSDALSRAQSGGAGVLEPQAVAAASESMQALFKPLEHINAEAASQHWFNKSAENLTAREAARLAAILPSPRRYRAADPGPYVRRRASRIQAAMGTVREQGLDRCVDR